MKSIGKLLGLVFLGLLLLIVGLGFALTHLFDPNDYKDEIRQLARDKANLELTLNGDIGWSLFPWLGIELHDATLASADTPEQPVASLQMIGLSVRLLPLLRKEIQMSQVRTEGMDLTLQRDQQGRGNWEGIGQAKSTPTAAGDNAGSAPAEPPVAGDDAETTPMQLDIASLSMRNTRIDYRDVRSGAHYQLDNLQLSSGSIREGDAIPLTFSSNLSADQPVLRGRIQFDGLLRFDRQLKRYQLEDGKFSGEVAGEPLQGKMLAFNAQGNWLLDQAANVAEWNNLKLSANQLRALGELKLYDLDKVPKLNGGISLARFNLREFLDGMGVTPPVTTDPNVLGNLELVTRLVGTPNQLALEDLKLKLDDSSFSGRIEIADLERQALRLQLKGDVVKLDRYLPPESKDSAAAADARNKEVQGTLKSASENGSTALPTAPTRQAWSTAELLPLERLRKLDLQAVLSMGQLDYKTLPLTNISLKFNGKDGLLKLTELNGDLLNGSIKATSQLDARPASPQLGLTLKLTRLPIERLVATSGKPSPIKGDLDLSADLRSSGNSEKALIDALSGNAHFNLADGVLLDANIEEQVCLGIAIIRGESPGKLPSAKDTPFEQLSGTLRINNGIATNPDLKVDMPGLAVNGKGGLDLRVMSMDYLVGIIVEGDQGQNPNSACRVSKQFVGVEWPIRCRGPLELGAKACRLDQNELGKLAAKLAGNKLTDKLGEKIEKELGDKVDQKQLKDALKGLFGR